LSSAAGTPGTQVHRVPPAQRPVLPTSVPGMPPPQKPRVSRGQGLGGLAVLSPRRRQIPRPAWRAGGRSSGPALPGFNRCFHPARMALVDKLSLTPEQEHGEPPLLPHPPRRRGHASPSFNTVLGRGLLLDNLMRIMPARPGRLCAPLVRTPDGLDSNPVLHRVLRSWTGSRPRPPRR
jgi:hypothetical protein